MGDYMRPASIVSFERFFLGALVVDVLAFVMALEGNLAALKANPATANIGSGALIATMLVYIALGLVLWFFAARQRSVVAKWILSAWFVVASCMLALSLFQGQFFGLPVYLGWIAFGLRAKAVSELFKPDADIWFGAKA